MTETCVCSTTAAPTCGAPRTHRVTCLLRETQWRVEAGGLDSVWRGGMIRTGDNGVLIGVQVPEFCVAHVESVCAQRNTPYAAQTSRRSR